MIPEIIFENKSILVVLKPAGVTSEDGKLPGVPTLLSKDGQKPLVVHRLDKEVSGIMVLAKTKSAAAALSKQITEGVFKKCYEAVVEGEPSDNDTLNDLLFHDKRLNKTYVVRRERKGVKEAVLHYKKIQTIVFENNKISKLFIELETGRTHQIRVQLASRKMAIIGDRKYGSSYVGKVALFSKKLKFIDPDSKRMVEFSAEPPKTFPWGLF